MSKTVIRRINDGICQPVRTITLTGVAALCLAVAACSTTTIETPAPVAATASPTQFNASAVTVAGCKALAQWENGPATGAEADAATSTQVQQIIHNSAGTQFSTDLLTWVTDLQSGLTDVASTDASQVDADCAAAGVPDVIGNG